MTIVNMLRWLTSSVTDRLTRLLLTNARRSKPDGL
jgi:hypothetical protein